MKINPEEFKPKVKGESDFFSWKLYRWLYNHKDKTNIFKCNNDLWIGELWDNDFVGVNLRHLCRYGRNPEIMCHSYETKDGWDDVNEWFWSEYSRIGVCAIHGDYAHKWNYLYPTKRKCEYCGKIETSYIETKRIEKWK